MNFRWYEWFSKEQLHHLQWSALNRVHEEQLLLEFSSKGNFFIQFYNVSFAHRIHHFRRLRGARRLRGRSLIGGINMFADFSSVLWYHERKSEWYTQGVIMKNTFNLYYDQKGSNPIYTILWKQNKELRQLK